MGLLTNFLNLFKYDPLTDGESTFNIDTALNENWDKIDAATKGINDSLIEHKEATDIHLNAEAIQDVIANLIKAGSNVNITYDDQNNQIQISSNYIDTNTQRSDEEIQDIIGSLLTEGNNVVLEYDDASNQLIINSSYVNTNTQRSDEEIRDVISAAIQGGTEINVTLDDTNNLMTISLALTDTDILNKLKSVDGPGSGLNADLIDGLHANQLGIGATGTYNGDGTYSQSISLGFKPRMVIITCEQYFFIVDGDSNNTFQGYSTGNWSVRDEYEDTNYVNCYSSSFNAYDNANRSGYTYSYVAFR